MALFWMHPRPQQPILKYWWWIYVFLILLLGSQDTKMESISGQQRVIECPVLIENSACPCYKFEDGKFLLYHAKYSVIEDKVGASLKLNATR